MADFPAERSPATWPGPRSAIGELLAAFLGGECRTCEGATELALVGGRWVSIWQVGVDDDVDGRGDCRDCHGHGTMLGALAPTLEEMAAEKWLTP